MKMLNMKWIQGIEMKYTSSFFCVPTLFLKTAHALKKSG